MSNSFFFSGGAWKFLYKKNKGLVTFFLFQLMNNVYIFILLIASCIFVYLIYFLFSVYFSYFSLYLWVKINYTLNFLFIVIGNTLPTLMLRFTQETNHVGSAMKIRNFPYFLFLYLINWFIYFVIVIIMFILNYVCQYIF